MAPILLTVLMMTTPLDAKLRADTVAALAKTLESGYADPGLGAKMAQALRRAESKGEYSSIKTGSELAGRLQREVRAIYDDKHLRVDYSAEKLPAMGPLTLDLPEKFAETVRPDLARENFGLAEVKVLPGNIGYMDFLYFAPVSISGPTYDAAMALVANTDGLVIDVRRCMGSLDPEVLPYFMGYFFRRPTKIAEIDWRPTQSTRQFWTAGHVAGPRYLDRPIIVLTSHGTFSGAEALAYDLQALKRATVIGERTGGGGNPGGSVRLNDHFAVWLPAGKGRNAITGKSFEGTGVLPDVVVPAREALGVAKERLLDQFLESAQGPMRAVYEVERERLRQTPDLRRPVSFRLKGHAGAVKVSVAGSFNYWSPEADPMRREGDAWVASVPIEPGRHTYKFIVDGTYLQDPEAPVAKESRFGDSVLIVR